MPSGGNKTQFSLSFVDYVASGFATAVRGVTGSTWFGPGQPLPPVAPIDQKTRIFDYPFAANLDVQPRIRESGISYYQLRQLSDTYDMLRLVIDTRKDQVVAIPQIFRLRPQDGESKASHSKRSMGDPRVKALNEMFRYPDGFHDWNTWLRALLEELFVIDAPAIAPRYAVDNSIMGMDVISGDTIVRKIDADGRTPGRGSVAYQQILKGLPAKDLYAQREDGTVDLIFWPRNYRANRIYGFSPVEQIIITVNLALRRQQSQLAYYTDGNIPESIAQVPEGWTPEQLQHLQRMFDTMSGDAAKRSRIRFVPKLDGILFTKDKILTDQFDEWLARIVCFAFSISPQPFIKMMNRATAQTAQETAQQEGLKPILDWISSLLTYCCKFVFGYDDIEHAYLDEEAADHLVQAQIDKIYISLGETSIDEVRQRDGMDPIGAGPMVMTATGPIPLAPFLKGGPMSEGLPQHSKSPDELDQEKQDAQDHADKQQQLAAGQNNKNKSDNPNQKVLKSKKKNY